jgi:hypothetical protein
MALMRHSDPRLTLQTYTDAQLLPTAAAIAKINETYLVFSPTSNAQIPIP